MHCCVMQCAISAWEPKANLEEVDNLVSSDDSKTDAKVKNNMVSDKELVILGPLKATSSWHQRGLYINAK